MKTKKKEEHLFFNFVYCDQVLKENGLYNLDSIWEDVFKDIDFSKVITNSYTGGLLPLPTYFKIRLTSHTPSIYGDDGGFDLSFIEQLNLYK